MGATQLRWGAFILFEEVINLILTNEHLTDKGLERILSIKASMNKGLSNNLKEQFPNISPVERPLIKDQTIINGH